MTIHYQILPSDKIQGILRTPGDKSISHRSIMLGSLAFGVTTIEGFLESGDSLATLLAFKEMGVLIKRPKVDKLIIHGRGLYGLRKPKKPLYLGNSGTSMRLLAGILVAQKFDSKLYGDESLSNRPMQRIIQPLCSMGAKIVALHDQYPPLMIYGNQHLNGIRYLMEIASAQVKSCLLLASLYAQGTTEIIECAQTRDHTERMLTAFNYPLYFKYPKIIISGGSRLMPTKITIPADLSSAAFFIVAACIATESNIILQSVGINPSRTGVITILKMMGANITIFNQHMNQNEPIADIKIQHAPLNGVSIPESLVSLAIDEFPILLIASACAKGVTKISGVQELRTKECDRINAMATGLTTLNINVKTTKDSIEVQGGTLSGGVVNSYNDHRIAMAFAIAGIKTNSKIIVKNCDCVATSFPTFLTLSQNIGVKITTLT